MTRQTTSDASHIDAQASKSQGGDGSGTPLGSCASDEPANTLPAEPVSIAKLKTGRPAKNQPVGAASDAERTGIRETPALHQESDIPSDGADPEGEAMIRQVPKRTGDGKHSGDGGKGRAG
ncbi:MAG: hypothetical protein Q7T87_07605 [Polaromonas sp.]|nr:hypothetical protein [Polaromonas sp.]